MAMPGSSTHSEGRLRYWLRVLRPLSWWFLLVLVLFGIRTHQQLMEQTRLVFTISTKDRVDYFEAATTLDGKPVHSGARVSLGYHQFIVTHPKWVPYTNRLFVWYRLPGLGEIALQRAEGELAVSTLPVAQRLIIRGPEFSVVLTNCAGFTSAVPTDDYVLEARYKYWQESQPVVVSAGTTTAHRFAPRFGTIAIESSHPNTTFELRRAERMPMASGTLPAAIAEMPEGSGYQLSVRRREEDQNLVVAVKSGTTNAVKVEFVYGAATVESVPGGATVYAGGRELGVTPLTLPELAVGTFRFSLGLAEYGAVEGVLPIARDQTNGFGTNLISIHYTAAMRAAQRAFNVKDYASAAESANEALKHRAEDAAATQLRREANTLGLLDRAEMLALGGDFVEAINRAKQALEFSPENERAKTLIANYTKREEERLEAIRKREAELAEQERQRRAYRAAEELARKRTIELGEKLALAVQQYENGRAFATHDLIISNSVRSVGSGIGVVLAAEDPKFTDLHVNWLQPHLFMIEARQRVGIGYRDCLILGSELRPDQILIRYMVFEYEHPPDIKVLGGLFQLSTDINLTSQDPKVQQAKAERFALRIKEGVKLVHDKIRRGIGDEKIASSAN